MGSSFERNRTYVSVTGFASRRIAGSVARRESTRGCPAENGERCEYNIGDNAYAIPKSSVERVEAGGAPASTSSGAAKVAGDLPSFAPTDSLANEGDLPTKIVHDGKVDSDVLSNLESYLDFTGLPD